jgi:hypothetical protein
MGWSRMTLTEVVSYIRLPKKLTNLTIMLVGCQDVDTFFDEEMVEMRNAQVLTKGTDRILLARGYRQFFKEVRSASELKELVISF